MLPKKNLFGSEKREKKLIKSQQWTKKNYDVLYKGPFSHIMPKVRKTLWTAIAHVFNILFRII